MVSLILKEGNKDDPNNYRAITVINSLAKVLAILINERLEKWCTEEKVIRKEQIGFKKGCRLADHMFVLKTLVVSSFKFHLFDKSPITRYNMSRLKIKLQITMT